MDRRSKIRSLISSRSGVSVLVFAAALLLFALPGPVIMFSSRGESREAVVAAAMLQQQNFILPLRNGSEIPSKPPLFHWLAVLAGKIAGSLSEYSVRFPSALAGAAALACFYWFVSARRFRRTALTAVLILASNLEWVRYSMLARVDMVFTLFVSLGCFLLFRLTEEWKLGRPGWIPAYSAGAALVFAVLAKGPAGLVLPWAVAGVYILLFVGVRKIRLLPAALSVLLSVGFASIWYYLAYREGGERFLDVHLMRENVARILGTKGYETGHGSPFYSTVLLFLAGALPWSLLVPLAAAVLWSKRRVLKFIDDPLLLFSLCWVGLFLLFFSITSSKRDVYLLPAFPAFAYLAASVIGGSLGPLSMFRKTTAFARWSISSLAALGLAALLAVLLLSSQLDVLNRGAAEFHLKANARAQLEAATLALASSPAAAVCLAAALLLGIYAGLRAGRNWNSAVPALAAAVALVDLVLRLSILPAVSTVTAPQPFISRVLELVPAGKTLYEYQREMYAAIWYAGRDIPFSGTVHREPAGGPTYLLVKRSDLPKLNDDAKRWHVVLESRNFAFEGRDTVMLVKALPLPGASVHPRKSGAEPGHEEGGKGDDEV